MKAYEAPKIDTWVKVPNILATITGQLLPALKEYKTMITPTGINADTNDHKKK